MKKLLTSLLVVILALTFSASVQAGHCKNHKCKKSSWGSNTACHQCGNPGCLYYKKHWINPSRPGVTMNYYGTCRPSYMSSLNNPHEYYRGANFYGKCGWQPRVYTVYYRTEHDNHHHHWHKRKAKTHKMEEANKAESTDTDSSETNE